MHIFLLLSLTSRASLLNISQTFQAYFVRQLSCYTKYNRLRQGFEENLKASKITGTFTTVLRTIRRPLGELKITLVSYGQKSSRFNTFS